MNNIATYVTGPDLFVPSAVPEPVYEADLVDPCHIMCGMRLRGTHCPRLLVPRTTLAGGLIFMTVCMCTAVPRKPPIKGGCFGQVSQSVSGS